jgi:hypothetical protein
MRRSDEQMPERRLIAGFAAAGVVLFAGTLLVGFSTRDIDRRSPPSLLTAPLAVASASTSGGLGAFVTAQR